MNDKIRELAEQAGFTRRKFYDGGEYLDKPTTPISSICIDFELKKFAELIVQECIEIIDYNDLVGDSTEYYGKKIKKHFGVEE